MNYADFFLKNQAKEKKHRRRIAAFLVTVLLLSSAIPLY